LQGRKGIDTLGGKQNVTFLTEFGLFELLSKSNSKIAKEFRRWVNNLS
jgi:prophage antirepressor-like protein